MALAQAFAAFQAGEYDKAEVLLKKVIEANPGHLPAMVAYGMVANASGRRAVAMDRMRAVLRIDRNALPALHWMCQLSIESDELTNAIEFGERALAIDPRNPETLQLLGNAQLGLRRYHEALALYDRALKITPNDARLHYRKAEALEKLTREPAAIEELKVATSLAPNQEGLMKLAYLQLQVGEASASIATCERVLERFPQDAGAHIVIGCALSEVGRPEEAQKHWDQADSLQRPSAWASMERARSLSRVGDRDGVARELALAIELDEKAGGAYHSIVSAKRITEEDRPLIEKMERVLKSTDLKASARVQILFALGKSYDNLGDYQAAIARFDEANKLQHETFMSPFDQAHFKSHVDQQIAVFTRDLFERRRKDGLESQIPVFVIGMMRSGTTLAEQILTCHSLIGGAGEQAFLTDASPEFSDWRSGRLNQPQVQSVGNKYLQKLQNLAPGFPRVVDKNPGNSMVLGALHVVFPNARVIHMRRNPVDTAISIWTTPMQTGAGFVCDRENIVFAYRQYQRLMNHWKSVLPEPLFLEIDYEALVADPAATTRQMTDFLGLEWEESLIHPENNSQTVRTPSLWQVRQPFYKSSAERWKHYEPWLGAFRELAELK